MFSRSILSLILPIVFSCFSLSCWSQVTGTTNPDESCIYDVEIGQAVDMHFYKHNSTDFGGDINVGSRVLFHGDVKMNDQFSGCKVKVDHLQYVEVYDFYVRDWINISMGPANFIQYAPAGRGPDLTASFMSGISLEYSGKKNDLKVFVGVGPQADFSDLLDPSAFEPTLRFRIVIPMR